MYQRLFLASIFVISYHAFVIANFRPFDYDKLKTFLDSLPAYSENYIVEKDGCNWTVYKNTAFIEAAGFQANSSSQCTKMCLDHRYKCEYGVSYTESDSATTCWLSNHHRTEPKPNNLVMVPSCPATLNQTTRHKERVENCVWYQKMNSYVRIGLPREARTVRHCMSACQRNRRVCRYGVSWADNPGEHVHKCLIASDLPPSYLPGALHLTYECNLRYVPIKYHYD